MTPRDAYVAISDWLFYHWFTDIENENCNWVLVEAIDKLDIATQQLEDIEDILSRNS